MAVQSSSTVDTLLAIASIEGAWLCGSRMFNAKWPERVPINETTDFDFRVPATLETANQLAALVPDRVVHQHSGSGGNYLSESVLAIVYFQDIQVVVDTQNDACFDVFQNMDPDFYIKYVWKKGKNNIQQLGIRYIIQGLICQNHKFSPYSPADKNSSLGLNIISILSNSANFFKIPRAQGNLFQITSMT